MTRHEVQIPRDVGMAQAAVAAKTGVSVQSLRRIEREAPVRTSEETTLVRQRHVGRPSVATPWTAARGDACCTIPISPKPSSIESSNEGAIFELRGPSYRTRHIKLDPHYDLGPPLAAPTRISGNHRPEFPKPTSANSETSRSITSAA